MTEFYIYTVAQLIMCHMLGDYFLTDQELNDMKSERIYGMIVHCVLYCVPFAFCFGFLWQTYALCATHFVIDELRERDRLSFAVDQGLHFAALLIYLI